MNDINYNFDFNKIKNKNRKNFKRNQEIKELRKQGLTYEEIGKRYGISRQRVEQICKINYQKRYYCRKELKATIKAKYGTIYKFSLLFNFNRYYLCTIMNNHTPIRYITAKKIHNALKDYKFEDLFEEVEI